MSKPLTIELDGGKYSVVLNEDTFHLSALRYGEPWRVLRGDNLVLSMFYEILKLRYDMTLEKTKVFLAARGTVTLSELMCFLEKHGIDEGNMDGTIEEIDTWPQVSVSDDLDYTWKGEGV